MAIVHDGWLVVARREVIETSLPSGLASWFELAPNRTACADPHLCAIAFMVPVDALTFLVKLGAAGLVGERDGAYVDVAFVGRDGPWEHTCSWLGVGRYGGVNAVWRVDRDPEPLVVPAGWRPNSIINLSDEEVAKRLKFVRRDGDVEVYLDTETGEHLFRGRTTPTSHYEPEIEARFKAVTETIDPLLTHDGRPRSLGFFERRKLAKGIRELEQLATEDRWRIWWFLGMARRAAGDAAGAFDAFERAYTTNPAQPDVTREFGAQCLALGRGERAVEVCEQNCTLHPKDAGLRANLALACVIADKLPRAKAEVTRALAMEPDDKITQGLARMIDDVIAGKRPRITKYP